MWVPWLLVFKPLYPGVKADAVLASAGIDRKEGNALAVPLFKRKYILINNNS